MLLGIFAAKKIKLWLCTLQAKKTVMLMQR
jgi:hypothetical protein